MTCSMSFMMPNLPRNPDARGAQPGMQELGYALANPATSDKDALRRLSQKYPTAGLAILEQDGGWRDIAPGTMRLATFITPRALGGVDED